MFDKIMAKLKAAYETVFNFLKDLFSKTEEKKEEAEESLPEATILVSEVISTLESGSVGDIQNDWIHETYKTKIERAKFVLSAYLKANCISVNVVNEDELLVAVDKFFSAMDGEYSDVRDGSISVDICIHASYKGISEQEANQVLALIESEHLSDGDIHVLAGRDVYDIRLGSFGHEGMIESGRVELFRIKAIEEDLMGNDSLGKERLKLFSDKEAFYAVIKADHAIMFPSKGDKS